MKIYKLLICTLLFSGMLFTSCSDDDSPDIDDYPLNYEIPQISVDADIPVGAFLYNPGGAFSDEIRWERITEPYNAATGKVGPHIMPELGRYNLRADTAGALAARQLVEWAKLAKIDFLITPGVREHANDIYPRNINREDSALVDLFGGHNDTLPSLNMGDMKYAISLDINNFCSGLSNNVLIETAPTHKLTIDGRDTLLTREERLYSWIKRVSHYFGDPTYYHSNGRPVLILNDADKLYSEDTKKIYDNIRTTIKGHTGKDVYIIARQPSWSPSARFEHFFLKGKADAVTMNNMCDVKGGQWDRTYWLNQLINENFKFNREYISNNYGIDFIPSVSASYSQYVANGDYSYPLVPKDPEQFRKRCNVAKMNLGQNRMALIESMNHWYFNTQIEPTVPTYGKGYGTAYLDIVREEFKRK